jgi:hypothetical protein
VVAAGKGRGRGRGGGVGRRECGGALMEEADGRGDGEAAPGCRRPAAARGKKGMAPTGGPHLSAAERERRWEAGAKWAGLGRKRSWAAGLG